MQIYKGCQRFERKSASIMVKPDMDIVLPTVTEPSGFTMLVSLIGFAGLTVLSLSEDNKGTG